MAPRVCFSLTNLARALLASTVVSRRTASLYTYRECLGTSGCPRLSDSKFAVRDYVQLHECAPFPAAQRHQTWQAPSPGPSEQILARTARAWRRLRAGLKPRQGRAKGTAETKSNVPGLMSAPLCRRRSEAKLGLRQAQAHLNTFWHMVRTARAWRRSRARSKAEAGKG